jgi:hypothetical protein
MNDTAQLQDFATRYPAAWCSQDPEKVAAFYAKGASISVNGDGPTTHSGCVRRNPARNRWAPLVLASKRLIKLRNRQWLWPCRA